VKPRSGLDVAVFSRNLARSMAGLLIAVGNEDIA